MRTIKGITLHCTASPQTQTVEQIKNYWKNVLGWKNPGYHYMIPPDGKTVNTLPISEIANGVAGYNAEYIHISYIGGVEMIKSTNSKGQVINVVGKPIDNRTPEQKLAMEILVWNFHLLFPDAEIKGHRDFSVDKNRDGIIQPSEWMKACPSFSVSDWLKEINLK